MTKDAWRAVLMGELLVEARVLKTVVKKADERVV
jgi:hypothetical protein